MGHLDDIARREQMIREQIVRRGIDDPAILKALRAVPRALFFPPDMSEMAYSDAAAAIGHGQTISQPYIVALMTQALSPASGHRVLEIGTGSGYQTAVLAHLAREIWTIERIKPLLDQAWSRLMELSIRTVHFRHGDGTLGWPEAAPFDRILIAAAAPAVPKKLLLSHLAEAGVAVVPVGDERQQDLVRLTRRGQHLEQHYFCPCRFVKLLGAEGWTE